ncbi:crosslink repair DNA glycosylase YcaQ family protein [Streptomyces sp. NPDC005388]|uniref:DNA glycosylase AlkZ-like family protein n=1 Tax=Streptomyces sp. NPDC005388 TaxID=3156717 RepID=UPI0033B30429
MDCDGFWTLCGLFDLRSCRLGETVAGAVRSPIVVAGAGSYAPIHHVPTGGSRIRGAGSGRRGAAAAARLPAGVRAASAQDFCRFTMLKRSAITQALHELGDQVLRVTGLGRASLFDVGDATVPAEDTPAPQSLLPMWDGALMAHTGAGWVVPEGYRPLVARHNGDMLPCLLVDGQVVGVWRAADGGLELTVFHKLGKVAWQGLAGEAERLSTPARRPRSSRLPVLRPLVEQGVSRCRERNRQGLTTPSGSAPRLSGPPPRRVASRRADRPRAGGRRPSAGTQLPCRTGRSPGLHRPFAPPGPRHRRQ